MPTDNTSSKSLTNTSKSTLERRRERQKGYYRKNKAKYYEKHRAYIQKNKEARRAYLQAYVADPANRKRRLELYKKNALKIRARDRAHYHKTRDRHRELRISLAHKITVEEYRRLHTESKGLCAICNTPEKTIHPKYGTPKVLAIDHNHKTGKVRGLLCQNCNNAIGHLHEDLSLLDKIKDYLMKYA